MTPAELRQRHPRKIRDEDWQRFRAPWRWDHRAHLLEFGSIAGRSTLATYCGANIPITNSDEGPMLNRKVAGYPKCEHCRSAWTPA